MTIFKSDIQLSRTISQINKTVIIIRSVNNYKMVVPIRGLIRKASFKMENIIRNNYEVTQTNDVSNIF